MINNLRQTTAPSAISNPFTTRVPGLRAVSLLAALLLSLNVYGASPHFAPISAYPSGGVAQFTATADVNRDGKQDVFASNLNGVISLLLGNGDGTFKAPKIIAVLPAGSYPILTADLNRDGKPDLAILDPTRDRVRIYLGLGDGSFQTPKSFATTASPISMAVGDVNGDHNPDLIVSTQRFTSTSSVVGFNVLLGEGNGSFHSPVVITAKNGAAGGPLAVGDVNGDGRLDVVTSDGQGSREVFLGNGNATFSEQRADSSDFFMEGQLLLADLHGSGKLDLIVGTMPFEAEGSSELLVYPGEGDGTFGKGASYPAGFAPAWVAPADLNGDGKLDIVTGNAYSNSLSVLLNSGGGKLKPMANFATRFLEGGSYGSQPGLLSIGDFNGDGRPDVAAATADGVNVLLNLGRGEMYAPLSIELYEYNPLSIFTADLNGDGYLDLGLTSVALAGPELYDDFLVLYGNGKGQFPASWNTGGGLDAFLGPVAAGDFNHDGKIDLAAYGEIAQGFYTFLNTGGHSFNQGPILSLPNQTPVSAAGDFNRDGYSDFAILDGNSVDVYQNQHNGTFSGPSTYKLGVKPSSLVTRDLNRDGKLDLIATDYGSDEVSILLGKGDGSFEAARNFSAGSHPNVVTAGDFNRDGKIDLAVGGDKIAVLLGHGDGTFGPPATYHAVAPVTYIAQVDLGNGIQDLVAACGQYSNNGFPYDIYLFPGKGDGTFGVSVPYPAGEDPQWLAIGDFNEDGSPDIIVANAGSSALTELLNQGGTRIHLVTSSASVKVGTPVTLTATVQASLPGLSRPTGTVAFKDGPSGFAFAPLVNGRAIITTSHLKAGIHTITASYWGSSLFNPHVSTPVTETVKP